MSNHEQMLAVCEPRISQLRRQLAKDLDPYVKKILERELEKLLRLVAVAKSQNKWRYQRRRFLNDLLDDWRSCLDLPIDPKKLERIKEQIAEVEAELASRGRRR